MAARRRKQVEEPRAWFGNGGSHLNISFPLLAVLLFFAAGIGNNFRNTVQLRKEFDEHLLVATNRDEYMRGVGTSVEGLSVVISKLENTVSRFEVTTQNLGHKLDRLEDRINK